MIVKLTRIESSDKGTYGALSMNGLPLCTTLELPWKYNKQNISCIPSGRYKAIRDVSPSKNKQLSGECFRLLDVPNRTNVLIHIGNYLSDTEGCLLVGSGFGNWNISSSTTAMKKILQKLPDSFMIDVHNAIF